MIKTIEAVGKTEEEAVAAALAELGKERDEVSIEIIERAKGGFLGIGASPAKVRVSYTYKEDNTEKTTAFLEGLLERMNIKAQISAEEKEDGSVCVNLSGENMGALIGRRGETLDAIQHLTNYAVNKGKDKRIRISIDAGDYRAKREESLKRLAEKMAGKAIKYRRNMTIEPMNSYERHVIHTALQDNEEVTTFSTGTEPNRRVVIAYGKGGNHRDERR